MQIFNTLTRQKEEFVPQVPGEYRIYVCGPTVYNYIHIGNARPLIVFDTLRRYLEYRGNKVIYVSNITDIDDKLIKKGQEEGTSMKEVAQRFEAEYLKDAAGLNCKKPTVQPRATEHIQQILDIVKDLIDSGHAYVAKNGDVYFRVKSDPEYGKLSHLKLDDLESGNRELRSQMEDDLKEDPADFAVWKAAKPGEPAWESPYGMGRPGWHIECSAMSRTHLGRTIDLHCGGQDLIFPQDLGFQSAGMIKKVPHRLFVFSAGKILLVLFSLHTFQRAEPLIQVRLLLICSTYPQFQPVTGRQNNTPADPSFFFQPAQRLSGIFTGKSKLRSDIYRCHIMIDSKHEYTHVLHFSFVSTIFYNDKHFRKESQLRLTMSALPFIISYGRNCGSSLYSSGEI